MKHTLVLRVTTPFEYLDEDPTHAIIPATTTEITRYQKLLEQAEAISKNIPDFNHLSIHDYTPDILSGAIERDELEKQNILPHELSDDGNLLLIPTLTEEELEPYIMRIEAPTLDTYKHGNLHYTGYVKHTDIRWETTSLHKHQLPTLHQFIHALEQAAE